jgi:hypothetical protein
LFKNSSTGLKRRVRGRKKLDGPKNGEKECTVNSHRQKAEGGDGGEIGKQRGVEKKKKEARFKDGGS